MKPRPLPKIVRAHLTYVASSGNLWWRIVYNKRPANRPAGWIGSGGYRHVKLFGVSYPATHLIWVIKKGRWPKQQIDHRDLNAGNNRWKNLRAASNAQNMRNKRARIDNKSGYKGVSWKKKNRQWCAQICVDGKVKHLGLFPASDLAHLAYLVAAKKHFGEFARGR